MNKPTSLILPPSYITSDDFIKKIKHFDNTYLIGIRKDAWLRAVMTNVSKNNIPNKDFYRFCKSIKGFYAHYNKKFFIKKEIVYDTLLYLEGMSDTPRAFFNEDFLESLCKKYNYYESPIILSDNFKRVEYLLLYDYVLTNGK